MTWLDNILHPNTKKQSTTSTSSNQGMSSAFSGNNSSSSSNWLHQWQSGASSTAKAIKKQYNVPSHSYSSRRSSYSPPSGGTKQSVGYSSASSAIKSEKFINEFKQANPVYTQKIPNKPYSDRLTSTKIGMSKSDLFYSLNPQMESNELNNGYIVNVNTQENARIAKLESKLKKAYNQKNLSEVNKIKKEMHSIVGTEAVKQYAIPTATSTLMVLSGFVPNAPLQLEKPTKITSETSKIEIKPTKNEGMFTFKTKNTKSGKETYGIIFGEKQTESPISKSSVGFISKSGYGAGRVISLTKLPSKFKQEGEERILFGDMKEYNPAIYNPEKNIESYNFGISEMWNAETGRTTYGGSEILVTKNLIKTPEVSKKIFFGLSQGGNTITATKGVITIRQPKSENYEWQNYYTIPKETLGFISGSGVGMTSAIKNQNELLPSQIGKLAFSTSTTSEVTYNPKPSIPFIQPTIGLTTTKEKERTYINPSTSFALPVTQKPNKNSYYLPSKTKAITSTKQVKKPISNIISTSIGLSSTSTRRTTSTRTQQSRGTTTSNSNTQGQNTITPTGFGNFIPHQPHTQNAAPIFPFIPPMKFGTGIGLKRSKVRPWAKSKGFTPSITAISLGLSSPKQRTSGFFSGLGIRYMPTFGRKRKTTSKKKPKKKKKKKKR